MVFLAALANAGLVWLLAHPWGNPYDWAGPSGGGYREEITWAGRLLVLLHIPLNYDSRLARDLALAEADISLAGLYVQKVLFPAGGILIGVLLLSYGETALGVLAGVVGGSCWSLPDSQIRKEAKKTRAEILRRIPAFLQALTMMTEAGMNLHPAMKAFAESEDSALGRELRISLDEAGRGAALSDALIRMAKRCGVHDLYRTVTAVIQAAERGSAGLTDTCRDLAAEAWSKRRDAARELGQQASAKMFLPLMLLVLPALFLFMMGPAVWGMIHNM